MPSRKLIHARVIMTDTRCTDKQTDRQADKLIDRDRQIDRRSNYCVLWSRYSYMHISLYPSVFFMSSRGMHAWVCVSVCLGHHKLQRTQMVRYTVDPVYQETFYWPVADTGTTQPTHTPTLQTNPPHIQPLSGPSSIFSVLGAAVTTTIVH